MATCVVCNQRALYYDFQLHGMACAKHASSDVQIAAVRSLASTLLKAITYEQVLDEDEHQEIALIIQQLRPLLKD